MGQAHHLPLRVLNLRIHKIRIVDDRIDLIRRLRHLSRHGHKLLLLCREAVRLCPLYFPDLDAVK